MKVLHVIPSIGSESGGPVRAMLANCRALHECDVSVETTLATTDQGLSTDWEDSFRARLPQRAELRVFPAVGRAAFTFSPRLFSWIAARGGEYDLMVIEAMMHPISTSAAWVARRKTVPHIVVPHGTLSFYTFSHRRTLMKRAYCRVFESRTLRSAAAVRFTSATERAEASRWSGTAAGVVIPHPYEIPVGLDGPGRTSNQQVLFLSRLQPVKGLDVLLPAFAQLVAILPVAKLVVAGSGGRAYEVRIRDQVTRLGLADHVEFPGFVSGETKSRLLCESAVFVLPSHHENFGLSVVEAMAAGLPVVISKNVGIANTVAAHDAGIVIEELTPTALVSALQDLLSDESRRIALGTNGRQLVRQRYAPVVVGSQLDILYRAAVAG